MIMSIAIHWIFVFEVFSLVASCDQGRNKGWTSRLSVQGAKFRGAKTSLEYSYASLNDGDTFWEIRRYANVIEFIYTNLDNIASLTPRLFGIVYCSYATNLYSMLLYWIL
jgi:hypothetical protein